MFYILESDFIIPVTCKIWTHNNDFMKLKSSVKSTHLHKSTQAVWSKTMDSLITDMETSLGTVFPREGEGADVTRW